MDARPQNEQDKQNEEKKKNEIAAFRYGIIAPVLHATRRDQKQYFREMAQKVLDVPHVGQKKYKWSTFKKWLSLYRREGYDALLPQTRNDKGKFRKIGPSLADIVVAAKQDYPKLSSAGLYRMLIEEGYLVNEPISEGTLRNFIRQKGLDRLESPTEERRKFEYPYPNDLWTADFMHGPRGIILDGRKSYLYLCAIIDDHSRLIVGAEFCLQENLEALETVFRKALLTYGLPKRVYCDNGSAFSSQHFTIVCARLGIALIHSRPYEAPGRGKVERLFRTIREKFLNPLPLHSIKSLRQINELFFQWLDRDYHKQYHAGIDARPIDKYLAGLEETSIRRMEEKELEQYFYQSLKRRVKNDSTVSIGTKLYEVPGRYIGSIIEIRFPMGRPQDLVLYENNQPITQLKPVDVHLNAARAEGIRFAEILGQKEEE